MKQKRQSLGGCNRFTVTIQITKTLKEKIDKKAVEYKMTKSQFLRALLEMIDDENLYAELLGPT